MWATGTTTSLKGCGESAPLLEAAAITQVTEKPYVCLSKKSFYTTSNKESHFFCVPATFSSNPQFVVRLEDVDDDPVDGKDGCTFLVGLMQKDGRQQRRLNRNLEAIGFAIYEVSQNNLIFHMKSVLCIRIFLK